ncbi:unnamed protein product [Brassica napus]|uniref:(rape) hypothetical protein n=1 Tax=Brassica napus TaxID=3708 RepID=A0A816KD04_BRANA|nr:unnamed protein product [Brassica napus]
MDGYDPQSPEHIERGEEDHQGVKGKRGKGKRGSPTQANGQPMPEENDGENYGVFKRERESTNRAFWYNPN